MRRTLEVLRIYPNREMACSDFTFYEEAWRGRNFIFNRSSLTIEGQGIRNRFIIWQEVDQIRGLQLDRVVLHEQVKLSKEDLFNLKAQTALSKVGVPIQVENTSDFCPTTKNKPYK